MSRGRKPLPADERKESLRLYVKRKDLRTLRRAAKVEGKDVREWMEKLAMDRAAEVLL